MLILAVDPPQFDYTKTILAATGLSTLIVGLISAVVQYFLKKSSDRQLATFQAEQSRQLESYKDALKRDADGEVEKLRNKLRLDSTTHEIRFRSLHEKRARVIVRTYMLLTKAHDSLVVNMAPMPVVKEQERRQEACGVAFNQFTQYAKLHEIYFSPSLAVMLDRLYAEMLVANYAQSHRTQNMSVDDEGVNEFIKELMVLGERIEPILKELCAEFRKLIGVEEK